MRALMLETFGRMVVTDVPRPALGSEDVAIRIAVTGICGSDIHGYTGENGRRVPGQIMGHESAGHVVALGVDVVGEFDIGDVVTFNPVVVPAGEVDEYRGREQHCPRKRVIGVDPTWVSSFAEIVSVPARNVVKLPPGVPVELGALVEPLAVALHAVRRSGVRSADRVLVTGGGPIGQSIVVALTSRGITSIVVTEPNTARRQLLSSLGAVALDPTEDDILERIEKELRGFADVAFDAVGIEPTLRTSLRATRTGGTVCLVGMGAPSISLDAFLVSTEERTVVGSFTYSSDDFREAVAHLGAEPHRIAQLISARIDLDDAPVAFSDLAGGTDLPGKVIVRIAAGVTEQ